MTHPVIQIDHWINGCTNHQESPAQFSSTNPSTGTTVCLASKGNEETVNLAVEAAYEAFQEFRKTNTPSREEWLLRAADILQQDADQFITALIDETGSPISKARREVTTSIGILRAAAGATRQISGKTFAPEVAGNLSYSIRVPLGVVAGMTPFNVPLIKLIKHSAMPLATGNTVVLLPSEETPLVASLVAKLYQDAGFPPGTFNIVYGHGAEIGDYLTLHPKVKQVGFTGSLRVGRHVQELCGKSGKRVTLELGGKNPLVVLKDADLAKAIPGCIVGSFLYQGQICMSSSRIYVEDEIADSFIPKFIEAANQVGWGDLHDPQTMVGPIINRRQVGRIRQHLEDAISKGAVVLTGNEWRDNLLRPTILTNVDSSMKVYHEETFGPVTTIHRVASPDEALKEANNSCFGLCGAIFTNQLDLAIEFANQLDAGMVHVNSTTIREQPEIPFGGTKASGFGREGSQVSIDELTQWKWVTMQ